MRRKDKEITDCNKIESIILRSAFCRLGMSDNNHPYVVPMSFGYRDSTVYFHSAPEGRKIDILQNNPNVCIQFDADCRIKKGETACRWGAVFQSAVGFGEAVFITDSEQKQLALDIIMKHYSDDAFSYTEASLQKITVFKVILEKLTGKEAA